MYTAAVQLVGPSCHADCPPNPSFAIHLGIESILESEPNILSVLFSVSACMLACLPFCLTDLSSCLRLPYWATYSHFYAGT